MKVEIDDVIQWLAVNWLEGRTDLSRTAEAMKNHFKGGENK